MIDMYDQRAIDLDESSTSAEDLAPPVAASTPTASTPTASTPTASEGTTPPEPSKATIPPEPSKATIPPGAAKATSPSVAATELGDEQFFEMTKVLVGLMELPLGWRQGHSMEVERLATGLARHIHLGATDQSAIRCAALLHELGKPAEHHLTALSLHSVRSLRSIAKKVLKLPSILYGGVGLPAGTLEILDNLYEQPNGEGIPGDAEGTSIPLGSRVLAVADAFCDLRRNPSAPFGRCDNANAAIERLKEAGRRGTLDPDLVKVLPEVLASTEGLPLANRISALLVDPRLEDTTLLEHHLAAEGFNIRVARTTTAAARLALTEDFGLILCELDTAPVDGFEFVERLRSDSRTQTTPVIFMTHRDGKLERQRAHELGVDTFLQKPLEPNILVAKARALCLLAGVS
ncbi:MAG: response regulator [Deltaproteobacteria bacterium]|nr:response regulator [Deltaproteobacteria bacterium]